MESLTTRQAYRAMFFYLEKLYKVTKSEDLGGWLGSMSLLDDGTPADSALWDYWMESVDRALASSDDDIGLKLS